MHSPEPVKDTGLDQPSPALAESDAQSTPRADLHDAIGWVIFGLAVFIASWRMDRLEAQHINPLTIPGLVPGLLGIGLIVVGVIIGIRSVLRGALREQVAARTPEQRLRMKRVVLTVILSCGYSMVLIGHGLPFWLMSALYVTGSILVFDYLTSDGSRRRLSLRSAGKAVLIGTLSSVAVWLVFQDVFLVRLP